jgi:hypothetical protein
MLRRWLAIGGVIVSSAIPARAAYTEVHQTGDDVRLEVDAAGVARIEHAVRYRVVAGALKQFDLPGLEKDITIDPSATITTDEGRELSAHVAPAEGRERTLRVTVDEAKGLRRGLYTFHLRYETDLVAAKELVKDGAMWRLEWASPPAPEGLDGMRVVVAAPPADTEPRALRGPDDGILATLRRAPDEDELELARPHVARGEGPVWSVRIDPKAFARVSAPEMRASPPAREPPETRMNELCWGGAILGIAIAFGALTWAKWSAFEAACTRAGGRARPLLPIGVGWRALWGGATLGGGVLLEALGLPTAGAALVALAMVAVASRAPFVRHAARGPGRWLALRPGEALVPAAESRGAVRWLDVDFTSGKIMAFAIATIVVAISWVARRLHPEAPYLVLLDALALVPIFATGRASQLPPDRARAPTRALHRVFERMRGVRALKVTAWARFPGALSGRGYPLPPGKSAVTARADELRLLALPSAAMPGLVGIEVGLAWGRTWTGWASAPEVLVRVHEDSGAAARMATLGRGWGWPRVTGRTPEERVLRVAPRAPTLQAVCSLVERLSAELVDRRLVVPERPYSGRERRLPPRERLRNLSVA